jgi:hypothetical protein
MRYRVEPPSRAVRQHAIAEYVRPTSPGRRLQEVAGDTPAIDLDAQLGASIC